MELIVSIFSKSKEKDLNLKYYMEQCLFWAWSAKLQSMHRQRGEESRPCRHAKSYSSMLVSKSERADGCYTEGGPEGVAGARCGRPVVRRPSRRPRTGP